MNAIVSVTRDWGIGNGGRLLVHNPVDMRYFREKTMGGTVVCGRTTFESFPGGALKGRRNVVLSGDRGYVAKGAEVVHSIEEARATIERDEPDSVWLIGGERVYAQLLPWCDRAYVTANDVIVPADAYFPNLEEAPEWVLESSEHGGDGFTFDVWRNTRVRQ